MAGPAPLPQLSNSGSPVADATRAARLRSWVVAVGALAIAAFAGSSAYDSWRDYNHVIATNSNELANVGKALAEQLEGSLQSIDVLLQATADWYSDLPADATPESINGTLATRAAALPQVALLTITDAQGVRRNRSNESAATDFSVTDRSYFTALRDDPQLKLFISEPIVTRSDGRTAFVLSRRLQDSKRNLAGVVAAIVELDEYKRFYHALNLGTKSAIGLYRDDGTLVLRQPPVPDTVGKRYPTILEREGAAAPSAALVHTSPIDGVPRFLVVTRVSHYPLLIAVGRDMASVLDPWRDETYRVAGRTLFMMLLGALAITAVVRQLHRIERGERALRESEERYALAMEGANEGHFDWNFDEGPSFLSPQMKLLHGRRTDAPVTTRDEWLAAVDIHRDDVGRLDAAARDHFEGRSDRFEIEYRVRHPDGEWHWLQVRGRCFRDASGKVHRLVGSAMDITARKNAESEKERLEIQLRQSQKMEAMGTLAGGIAHDFNNILGAILGYGELAQKAAPEGGAVRRYLDNVMQAGGRAKSLVERILAFSRSGIGERGPINVQAVIEETLELMSASLPRGVSLVKHLDAGDAAIIGDATQLHQVAMNLGTNALQAMENGGMLEVVLERADVAQSRRLSHGSLGPGCYVRLCVSDTGSGIPPDVLDRMFDPFFTTKGVGEGTGLGLSLVHGIVTDLDGAIDVRSAIGKGTTFTIWLPTAGEATVPSAEVAAELPHGHGETVMIVDDEKALVALSEEMLAELGYEPIGFNSSVAALQAFRESPERFDIVLTDETMPELTGTALAHEVHALRPDVPVVLMSGYAGTQMLERARAVGISEILRKPLQSVDIAECFGRVLRSLDRRKQMQS